MCKKNWDSIILNSKDEVLNVLAKLEEKGWLSRGQSKPYGRLIPSIDRNGREHLSRLEKLRLERESIHLFQSTALNFSDGGEKFASSNDLIALAVLRHYGVPTRILDWSRSPYVAAYFSVSENKESDGEIWSFDKRLYEEVGGHQWEQWPETTYNKSGKGRDFKAELTMFNVDEPPNWFICAFYSPGFPRQKAQLGAYTLTARFNVDHDQAIATLLGDPEHYKRYIIPQKLKPELEIILQKNHGIWRGKLYPDSAGAAETAMSVFRRNNNPHE